MTAATSPASSLAPAAAIRCRGLVKHYPGDVVAVAGLDLEVRAGECFGLLGPNGAGKTTTVEILEGLLQPSAGEVTVLSRTWDRDEAALRERIGVSLQQTNLPDRMSVAEILTLFRSFYERGASVEEVLQRVSLQEKRDAHYGKLSGGQKQRLAVACALVGDPELLFLDEPTTGLDPQSRRQLWDLVLDFKREGRTVLLTTHYMDEAERLCDRVAVVDRGQVVAQGSPRELIASLGGDQVVEFAAHPADPARPGLVTPAAPTEIDEAALRVLPSVRAARRSADGFALTVEQVHVALPALLAHLRLLGLTPSRLSTHQATLEDVFVTLTGRHLRD